MSPSMAAPARKSASSFEAGSATCWRRELTLASSRQSGREERLRLLLSQQSRGSSDEPSPFVNIEFHQAFVSHFQQQGLAGLLIHDIGPFHDLVDFERLLAERAQDIFSIIQHDCSLQTKETPILTLE